MSIQERYSVIGLINRGRKFIGNNLIIVILFVLSILSLIVIALEISGIFNYITNNPPYKITEFSNLIGAVGSLLLSALLVILYNKQTTIQASQEQLMESEHRPKIVLDKSRLTDNPEVTSGASRMIFTLSNSGKGSANNIKIRIVPIIDSDLGLDLPPTTRKVRRDPDQDDEPFFVKGDHLKSQEEEVDFWFSPMFDWSIKWSENRGTTGADLFPREIARVIIHEETEEEEYEELAGAGIYSIEWETVEEKIDFDRIRFKYIVEYEDTNGNESSEVILDWIIPTLDFQNPSPLFDRGMEYERYVEENEQLESDPIDFYYIDHTSNTID